MFTSLIESLFKYLFRPKPLWDPQGLAFLIRSRNRIDSPLEQRRWQNGLNRLHSIEAEKNRNLALLKADPFNKGIQKKIEEIIQQKDVVESFKSALIDIPGGPIVPSSISPTYHPKPRMSLIHPAWQASTTCKDPLSPWKSTTTRSRPWSTPAPVGPPYLLTAPNPAASCG